MEGWKERETKTKKEGKMREIIKIKKETWKGREIKTKIKTEKEVKKKVVE